MAYKSTTDHAAEIRAAYKARGWSNRKVSVRAEYFSLGSSIHVEIKHPEVDETEATRIAEEAESIRRCEITGEILSGGNRYVSVSHSPECEKAMAAPYVEAVEEALRTLAEGGHKPGAGAICGIAGIEEAGVSLEPCGFARLWVGSRREIEFHHGSPGGIVRGAFQLARLLRKKS